MHRHHLSVAPHLATLGSGLTDDDFWQRRKGFYLGWLAEPQAFALIAEANGAAVGYALVHLGTAHTVFEDSTALGVIESLAVLPEWRALSIGSQLLERACLELKALGIQQVELSVVAGNDRAMDFYSQHGFQHYMVTMLRSL